MMVINSEKKMSYFYHKILSVFDFTSEFDNNSIKFSCLAIFNLYFIITILHLQHVSKMFCFAVYLITNVSLNYVDISWNVDIASSNTVL